MIETLFVGQREPRQVVLAGLLCVMLVIGVAAVAASATVGSSLPATTIAAGNVSRIHTLTRVIVRDQAAWTDLWRRHTGRADAPPAVNFDRDKVVAVFAGDAFEPVAVSIARIVRESDRLVVTYTLASTRPMADARGPVIAPFHIVLVARLPLPVTFVLRKRPQGFPHEIPNNMSP